MVAIDEPSLLWLLRKLKEKAELIAQFGASRYLKRSPHGYFSALLRMAPSTIPNAVKVNFDKIFSALRLLNCEWLPTSLANARARRASCLFAG